MNISFNIPDFLILALVVQGLILCALLLYTSKKIKSNFYIGAIIFVISQSTMNMELDYSGAWLRYSWLSTVTVPLTITLGPLIYFYTRSLIYGDQTPAKRAYLHFIPAFFFMKEQFIFLLYSTRILSIPTISNLYVSAAVQNFLFGAGNITVVMAFLSLVVYTGYSYRLLTRNLGDDGLSASKQLDLKWLKRLLQLIMVLAAIWLVSIVITSWFSRETVEPWLHYFLYFPAILFVYWLGMTAYIRQSRMLPAEIINYNKPVARRYYADTDADKHWQQLKALMEVDKVYLNPSLKLDELATRLNLPAKSVSSLLNQYIGKNFNDFVNEYRVEEAKSRLADPSASRFTIAAIALDCGFNSLATFQRCFKQFAGTTPSQYQNNLNTQVLTSNTTQIGI